jgi:hypothetical protein
MKKTLSFILFLPVYLFAQNKTTLPRIESITGDTIKGKLKDIVWKYDHLNRVECVVERSCFLCHTVSNPTDQLLIDTTLIQCFEYTDDQLQPRLRKVLSYDYERKEYDNSNSNTEPLEYVAGRAELYLKWNNTVLQYFIYQNGKRVGDSVIHLKQNYGEKDTLVRKGETSFKQTNTTIQTVYHNIVQANDDKIVSKDSVVFHVNVSKASSLYNREYENYTGLYDTYAKFDTAINPFHQLNIASCLTEEKVSFDMTDLNIISNDFDLEDAVFHWYYINQNNPVAYEIKRRKYELPFKDYLYLSYTYNVYQLPVSCTIHIKKLFSNGTFAGKYQKRFTFRYVN